MGNNAAFTQFEATVIKAYDRGILSPEFLCELGSIHEGSDIDSGGKEGTLSKDGLEVEQVVIKVMGGDVPTYPDVPKDYKTWTDEQRMAVETFWEELDDKFRVITDGWGWR